jgi:hypothetical protein
MYTYILDKDFNIKQKMNYETWRYLQGQKSDHKYYWNKIKLKQGEPPVFRIQKIQNNELITLIEFHIRY